MNIVMKVSIIMELILSQYIYICKLNHEDGEGVEGNYEAGSYYIKCEASEIDMIQYIDAKIIVWALFICIFLSAIYYYAIKIRSITGQNIKKRVYIIHLSGIR